MFCIPVFNMWTPIGLQKKVGKVYKFFFLLYFFFLVLHALVVFVGET